MIEHVKKVWGSEDWLVNNDKYCTKFLNLNRGYECSVHYHVKKDETFYVLCGEVELFVVDLKKIVMPLLPVMDDDEVEAYHKTILSKKDIIIPKLKRIVLKHGEQFRLKPYTAHKFRSLTFAAKLLEASTTHYEEDSYRLTNSQKL